jgi:2'-5' RNA ligase
VPDLAGRTTAEHLGVRMFVAVWPDESTRNRISTLQLGPIEGLRPVRAEHWHITLRFLGEVDEKLVTAITEALEAAAGTLAGVRCALGPGTAWFGGDRVLQIPAKGLDQAASAVRRGTIPIVPDTSTRGLRFAGHLTVARRQGRSVGPATRADLAGMPFVSTFDVDCFDLVKSDLADEGPEYTTLARIPIAR